MPRFPLLLNIDRQQQASAWQNRNFQERVTLTLTRAERSIFSHFEAEIFRKDKRVARYLFPAATLKMLSAIIMLGSHNFWVRLFSKHA